LVVYIIYINDAQSNSVHTCSSQYGDAGRAKETKQLGAAVNAACHGNLCAIGWSALLYTVDHTYTEFQTAPELPNRNESVNRKVSVSHYCAPD